VGPCLDDRCEAADPRLVDWFCLSADTEGRARDLVTKNGPEGPRIHRDAGAGYRRAAMSGCGLAIGLGLNGRRPITGSIFASLPGFRIAGA